MYTRTLLAVDTWTAGTKGWAKEWLKKEGGSHARWFICGAACSFGISAAGEHRREVEKSIDRNIVDVTNRFTTLSSFRLSAVYRADRCFSSLLFPFSSFSTSEHVKWIASNVFMGVWYVCSLVTVWSGLTILLVNCRRIIPIFSQFEVYLNETK